MKIRIITAQTVGHLVKRVSLAIALLTLCQVGLNGSLPVGQVAYALDGTPTDQRSLLRQETTYSLTEINSLYSQTGWGPIEINQSIGEDLSGDGGPLTIGGVTYDTGIGTHSTSVIAYDLEGKCSVFSSDVGIDDEVGIDGSAVFQVFGNQEKLYDSGTMNGSDPAKSTGDLNIEGVNELLLIVTDAEDIFHEDHANWAMPEVTCTSKPDGDGASFRHLRGYWEPVMNWPVKAIHASLLPSGHILSHASAEPGAIGSNDPNAPHNMTKVDLADIQGWTHEWVDHESEEMYCSSHTLLSDGSVFEFGGHGGATPEFFYYGQNQTSIFDFATKSWTVKASMSQPRWYPSAVTLGNGQVMAIGGSHAGGNSFKPEIWTGNGWRTLNNASYEFRTNNNDVIFDHTYPFVHLASDGRVFWAGWDNYMAYLTTTGEGLWSQNYLREDIQRAWGSPVMYRQDKILLIGGIDPGNEFGLATKSAVTVDLTNDTPVTTLTEPMLFPRADVDGTLLANGEVLVNGGGYDHILGYSPNHIYIPEIWNPDSGEWTQGTAAANPRGYHSSSLLLPDGRVWTGGGECGEDCDKGLTAQVYNPPYLFNKDGSGGFAARPVINSAPELISYGSSFKLDISSGLAIEKLTFIRLGSTTHHINFEQRYMELEFEKDGTEVTAIAPANGNLAPPGYYMLFAINEEGIPSVAKTIQILPMTPTPASCNLLKNSEFELGMLHWVDHGGAAPTSDAESGTGAVSISSDWIGQEIDAAPGQRFIYSGYYKTTAASFQLSTGIDFLNSAGIEIGEAQIPLIDAPDYTPFSLGAVAPEGTASVSVWLYSDTGSVLLADSLDIHVDGCVENVAPTLTTVTDQTNLVDESVSLALTATDDSELALDFGATNLPPGLAITTTSPVDAVISGTLSTVGVYTVTVTVTDTRDGVDSSTFAWTVSEPTNNPPIVSEMMTQTHRVGEQVTLNILAVDNDGDAVEYSGSGLPPGLTVDAQSGLISGTITMGGTYTVTITAADDAGDSDSMSFTWMVDEMPNQGPTVTPMTDQSHAISDAVEVAIIAVDPNGDPLSYTASDLPPGLSIDSESGLITGSPTEAGDYAVIIIVADDSNYAEVVNFNWQIDNASSSSQQNAIFLPHF